MTEISDGKKPEQPLRTAEEKVAHAKSLKESQQQGKPGNPASTTKDVSPNGLVLVSPYQDNSQAGSQSGKSERIQKDLSSKSKIDGPHTVTDETIVTVNANRSVIETKLPDGRIHKLTRYPQGGFLEQGYLEDNGYNKRGDIYAKDIGIATELARKKSEELKQRFKGISFSEDSDPPVEMTGAVRGISDDKTYPVRGPVYAELLVIQSLLERSQVAHVQGLKFVFSAGRPFSLCEAYYDIPNNQIGVSSSAINKNLDPVINDTTVYDPLENPSALEDLSGPERLIDLLLHESCHKSAQVRYGQLKKVDPKIEFDLAKKYGFEKLTDIDMFSPPSNAIKVYRQNNQDQNSTGPKTESFDLFTFYDKAGFRQCGKYGYLDMKAEPVTRKEIMDRALVSLPTGLSCLDPLQADAEGLALLRRGGNSRRLLLQTRSRYDPKEEPPPFYRAIVEADAKEINMAYPPSKKHPHGWIRAVSGELVARTPANVKALLDWEIKNNRKSN